MADAADHLLILESVMRDRNDDLAVPYELDLYLPVFLSSIEPAVR